MADSNVVSLPLHDATGDIARRRPGRPRKVEKKPSIDDLVYHEEIAKQRLDYLDKDDIVAAVRGKIDPKQTIHEIRVSLAKEAADLEFQKLELGKRGRDVAQVISRRADILLRLAHLELDALRLDATILDPRSEQMQRVFGIWVEDIQTVATETLPQEQADAFFVRLEVRMKGWEDRVEEALR